MIGRCGPMKNEDRAIMVPEGIVDISCALAALEAIPFQICFSRENVKPDGSPFILAFPLGIVLNYCTGLCCSRVTGPSYIIGIGDYEDGGVWILDKDGDVEKEIPCPMQHVLNG